MKPIILPYSSAFSCNVYFYYFFKFGFCFNCLKLNDINRQYKFQRGAFMVYSTVVKLNQIHAKLFSMGVLDR